MEEKQSNLVVAADVTTKRELLALAQKVGPEIALLKTHMDIITDFDWDLIIQLKQLATTHKFLIIEDRKFADIGSVVQLQCRDGMYKCAQWADLVTVHAVCGLESIKALEMVADDPNATLRGILLISQLSCKGNLIDSNYRNQAIAMAQDSNFVIGLIAQESCGDPTLLTFTPGISMSQKGDSLGQQYNSPEHAIHHNGTDLIIVGRAIYNAADPATATQEYRKIAWDAYKNRRLSEPVS